MSGGKVAVVSGVAIAQAIGAILGGAVVGVAAVGAAAAVAAVATAATVGVTGLAITAVAGTVAVYTGKKAFETAVETGKEVKDDFSNLANTMNQERELVLKAMESYRNFIVHCDDEQAKEEYANKLREYLLTNSEFITSELLEELERPIANVCDRICFYESLMELEAKLKILKENIISLNSMGESTCEFLERVNGIKEKHTINEMIDLVDMLNEEIKQRFDILNEENEENLKSKVFKKDFIELPEFKEILMVGVFSKELEKYIEQSNEDSVIDIKNELLALELLKRVYEYCSILTKDENFEDYADEILLIWSSCIDLYHNKLLTDEEYEREIKHRLDSLESLKSKMDEDLKNRFENERKFKKLLEINNKLRTILHLDPSPLEFNNETVLDEILNLEEENSKFTKEYTDRYIAERLIVELKKSYLSYGYLLISEEKITLNNDKLGVNCYFLMPDGKNVLYLHVDENGKIFEQVIGVKIEGLNDDPQSVLNAQFEHEKHGLAILKRVFEEIGLEYTEPLIVEPSLDNSHTLDLSEVLPKEILNKIKDNRNKRAHSKEKEKAIHG